LLLPELTILDISEVSARLFSSLLAESFLYCRLEVSSRSEKARLYFLRELVLVGPSCTRLSDLLCFFLPARLEGGTALRLPKTAERTAGSRAEMTWEVSSDFWEEEMEEEEEKEEESD